jgi:hypothetical protein
MRDERDRAALPGFFVGQRGSGFAAARKLVFRLPWHANNGNRQPENPYFPISRRSACRLFAFQQNIRAFLQRHFKPLAVSGIIRPS